MLEIISTIRYNGCTESWNEGVCKNMSEKDGRGNLFSAMKQCVRNLKLDAQDFMQDHVIGPIEEAKYTEWEKKRQQTCEDFYNYDADYTDEFVGIIGSSPKIIAKIQTGKIVMQFGTYGFKISEGNPDEAIYAEYKSIKNVSISQNSTNGYIDMELHLFDDRFKDNPDRAISQGTYALRAISNSEATQIIKHIYVGASSHIQQIEKKSERPGFPNAGNSEDVDKLCQLILHLKKVFQSISI